MKRQKARTVVERGNKSLLCGPGSELRRGWREKRRAKITNGIEKNEMKLRPAESARRDPLDAPIPGDLDAPKSRVSTGNGHSKNGSSTKTGIYVV